MKPVSHVTWCMTYLQQERVGDLPQKARTLVYQESMVFEALVCSSQTAESVETTVVKIDDTFKMVLKVFNVSVSDTKIQ